MVFLSFYPEIVVAFTPHQENFCLQQMKTITRKTQPSKTQSREAQS